MSHLQDSFGLSGGCIAYLHRPTLGWTVGEYILTWQSKQASSTVQPWVGRLRTTPSLIWRHTRSAEEAFLSLFANRLPLYAASKLASAERILRDILELVAAITEVFYIMEEEVLGVVVDESDEPACVCESYRCKTVSQGLQKLELIQFPCCGGRGIGVKRKSGRTLMMRPLWFCCGSRDNRIRTDDLFNVTEAL